MTSRSRSQRTGAITSVGNRASQQPQPRAAGQEIHDVGIDLEVVRTPLALHPSVEGETVGTDLTVDPGAADPLVAEDPPADPEAVPAELDVDVDRPRFRHRLLELARRRIDVSQMLGGCRQ